MTENNGRQRGDNRYEMHCKPRLDALEGEYKTITNKVDKLIAIVTNGLKDAVVETKEQGKRTDNRVWGIAVGVLVSIGMQIVFKVVS